PSDTKFPQLNEPTSGNTFCQRRTAHAHTRSPNRMVLVAAVSDIGAVGCSAFTNCEILRNGPPPTVRFWARSLMWSVKNPTTKTNAVASRLSTPLRYVLN